MSMQSGAIRKALQQLQAKRIRQLEAVEATEAAIEVFRDALQGLEPKDVKDATVQGKQEKVRT